MTFARAHDPWSPHVAVEPAPEQKPNGSGQKSETPGPSSDPSGQVSETPAPAKGKRSKAKPETTPKPSEDDEIAAELAELDKLRGAE